MRILFCRPPRYMWPWNSESSSFWQPLGFASMASVLRKNDFEVSIIDCLPEKIGWRTLKRKISRLQADVLCVGDETASASESVKLAAFAKEVDPQVTTIAGGYFFPNMEHASLKKWHMDYLVRGEGEQSLLDLIGFLDKRNGVQSYTYHPKRLKTSGTWNTAQTKRQTTKKIPSRRKDLRGISYLKNGKTSKIINTAEQDPLDLDAIPLPAYDLLPMSLYGRDSTNHKDFAAIEHGRGCSGGCPFCSISAQFSCKGKPYYRTKSPQRSFQETEMLVSRYKRKTLNWTDGTFNLDLKWSEGYFDLLEEQNIKVQHTAWMRADCIIRDEKQGVLKKMVDNKLSQAVVGMERIESDDLSLPGKERKTSIEAFRILKKYKGVYTIASLIYGLPNDNWDDLKRIKDFIYDDIVDFQFILPFTPYPGTPIWDEYKDAFTLDDFRSWNLHRPVMGTKHLSRDQLDRWFKGCLLSYLAKPSFYRRNYHEQDRRKRNVQRSLSKKLLKGLGRGMIDTILCQKDLEYGKKPRWYDS